MKSYSLGSVSKMAAKILVILAISYAAVRVDLSAQSDYSALPKRALLSGAGVVSYGDISIPQTFQGPISGEVFFSGKDCSFTVKNSSATDEFKVNLQVMQFNFKREKSVIGSFTYRLKPGATNGQTVHLRSTGSSGCALILNSWSVLTAGAVSLAE